MLAVSYDQCPLAVLATDYQWEDQQDGIERHEAGSAVFIALGPISVPKDRKSNDAAEVCYLDTARLVIDVGGGGRAAALASNVTDTSSRSFAGSA